MTPLCFYAHHRCASSWCNDILRGIALSAGWRHRVVHNTADIGDSIQGYIAREQPDILTFSNARPEYASQLGDYPGLHLIRDPRDVLVSSYFAHRYSHPTDRWPELVAHRRELQRVSKEEGLLLELDCRAEQFEAMGRWNYHSASILEERVETFVPAAANSLMRLFERWGRFDEHGADALSSYYNLARGRLYRHGIHLPPGRRHARISRHTIEATVARNVFERKSGGRAPGDADHRHHYRSGLPNGWRGHFFPELRLRFKARYNDLLVDLGYETSENW